MKPLVIIALLICQISFGQEKDITKDFNYKKFESFYNEAVELSNNGTFSN